MADSVTEKMTLLRRFSSHLYFVIFLISLLHERWRHSTRLWRTARLDEANVKKQNILVNQQSHFSLATKWEMLEENNLREN